MEKIESSIYRTFNKIRNLLSTYTLVNNYDKEELLRAFKVFWAAEPTAEEFSRVMAHIPIDPEIVYHMVTNPIKGGCTCQKKS